MGKYWQFFSKLRPKPYSYLTDDIDKIMQKDTKKFIIKRKLKPENYTSYIIDYTL